MEWNTEERRRKVRPQPAWERGVRLDPVVARSVRRFPAGPGEELVERLLGAADPPPGAREAMDRLVSDVLALGYYQALRDGARDPVTADVAARVLAGLERRLRNHVDRLRRLKIRAALKWRARAVLEVNKVLLGHGRALRRLGVPWLAFVTESWARYEHALAEVRRGSGVVAGPRVRARPRGLF
nr:hypothetical protein [Amycolatopsis benzoatilytica]